MTPDVAPVTAEHAAGLLGLSVYQQWVALAALAIGALVRILKTEPPVPPLDRLSPKARPLLALVLGQVSAVLSATLLPGVDWKQGLMGGVVSSAIAVFGHQVFIEWLRGGRELFVPKTPASTEALLPPTPTQLHAAEAALAGVETPAPSAVAVPRVAVAGNSVVPTAIKENTP